MSRTDAFARDFCRRMQQTEKRDFQWKPNFKPLVRGHESVDIAGSKKGRRIILIEVELRKDAPLTNVVKVWRWVENEKFANPFVFIQAFSKYYKKDDTKRSNAEFVGKRMQEATRNRYLSVPFDYKPYRHGKQGGGARRHQAFLLANKIRRKLKDIR